jgi:hypothetical protein
MMFEYGVVGMWYSLDVTRLDKKRWFVRILA